MECTSWTEDVEGGKNINSKRSWPNMWPLSSWAGRADLGAERFKVRFEVKNKAVWWWWLLGQGLAQTCKCLGPGDRQRSDELSAFDAESWWSRYG